MTTRSGMVRAGAAALSGVLYAVAFPEPGLWPLVLVAWVPLLLALRGASPLAGAGLGWLAGAVAHGALLRWMGPLSTLGLFALAAYLGAYLALFGAAAAHLRHLPFRWRAPATVGAFVALEWLRGWLFGGFGWGAAGYALAPVPLLAQLASVGGVALLGGCVMTTNVALAEAIAHLAAGRRRPAIGAAGVALVPLAIMVAHGLATMPAPTADSHAVRVAAVQADVSPLARWERGGVFESMQRYVQLTDAATGGEAPDLVLWPETAIPTPLRERGLAVRRRGIERRVAEVWNAPVLLGVPERTAGGTLHNSAILITPTGRAEPTYRKRRLVPFGEYTPDVPLLSSTSLVIPGPEFVPGTGGDPFRVGDTRVGVLICFEDVFADEAIARARDADVLAVLTNDGWFGASGRRQHLDVAVLRAIETRRPIARAASTGVSAVIDRGGRIVASAPSGPGHVTARIEPSGETTPYARWPDAVPLLGVLLAVAALAWASLGRRDAEGVTASGRGSTPPSASSG